MRRLLKKNVPFVWTQEMQENFQQSKDQLARHPQLDTIDPSQPLIILTDASNKGIGYTLIQNVKGKETLTKNNIRIIRIGNKALTPSQIKYDTTDKEYLAIRYAISRLYYLLGTTEVVIYTDHQPLTYTFRQFPNHPRNASIIATLQEFNIKIKYIQGKQNTIADTLSRMFHEPIEAKDVEGGKLRLTQSIYMIPPNRTLQIINDGPIKDTLNLFFKKFNKNIFFIIFYWAVTMKKVSENCVSKLFRVLKKFRKNQGLFFLVTFL